MKTLYIFGNGFDLAQGLSTRYSDFYQYLESKTGSFLLDEMKDSIGSATELWSDMEVGLGVFTEFAIGNEDFESFYYELSDLLQDYLKHEEYKIIPSKEKYDKFMNDLENLSDGMEGGDVSRFNEHVFRNFTPYNNISIITLNYTHTIEKLVEDFEYDNNISSDEKLINNIIHLHGELDDTIIIGVDNESQIAKVDFKDDEAIKDILVKEQSNFVMKNGNSDRCRRLISEADIIVLFGVSLGETDARWWKYIGDILVNRKNTLIIQHVFNPNYKIMRTRKQQLGKFERDAMDNLLSKLDIDITKLSEIRNRIFFIYNSTAFSKS